MDEVSQTIIAWGLPWGLVLLVLFLILFYLEKAERIGGWLLSFLSWLSIGIKHRSIRLRIQGQISNFTRSINSECKGSMPYGMKLNFIKDVDCTELDPNKQMVIVCVKDRGNDERNIVHTMMTFCPIGVVPQARPYLSSAINEGINITVTRKLLNYLKHYSALQYLYNEVLPACIVDTPSLDDYCKMFDVLDENGLFTRVFLSEIRDFGASIQTRYPDESHTREALNFLKYVHSVATRPEGAEILDIGHFGRYISTAFVFIGTAGKPAPIYIRHIQKLRGAHFEKAYIAARGAIKKSKEESQNIQLAERVSHLVEYKGLAKRGRSMRYYATTQDGVVKEHSLIELQIIPP